MSSAIPSAKLSPTTTAILFGRTASSSTQRKPIISYERNVNFSTEHIPLAAAYAPSHCASAVADERL